MVHFTAFDRHSGIKYKKNNELRMKIDLASALSKGRFRYMAIVEAIAEGITKGRLQPGERLPAQRDLAQQLGIAPGTVTRAYAEAERRGLITGKVGSGTFVSRSSTGRASAVPAADHTRPIDLTLNRLHTSDGSLALLGTALERLRDPSILARLSDYQPSAGHPEHRAAGAQWLARKGPKASPDQVILCNGLQHGLAVIFAALSTPGDMVLTEELNYPGLKLLDGIFHLGVQGLPMDDRGLLPDALEKACRQGRGKFLICTPTVHNPTNVTMPPERRQEVAEIARKHDLLIIELDEINGLLPTQRLQPFGEFAPERSCFVTSTWKTTEAGIAIGYIAAPGDLVAKLTAAVHATTWMPSPLLPEIVSLWINDGTAEKISDWHHREIAVRQETTRHILGKSAGLLDPLSYNIWLNLPEPWRREYFVSETARRNVLVTPAEAFIVGRAIAPHAVRINLGGAEDRALVEHGLRVIAEVIEEGPRYDRIIA
jgi:DNA-binding transcriptional MocR family regulator